MSKSDHSKARDVEDSPEDRKKKKVSFPEKGDKTSKGTKPTPGGDDDSETPEPIDESGLLTLSILDSADSKEVNLNYHREKETKPAFVGGYSDCDSNEDGGGKKGKSKKGKKGKSNKEKFWQNYEKKRRVETPEEEFKAG